MRLLEDGQNNMNMLILFGSSPNTSKYMWIECVYVSIEFIHSK